MLEPICEAKHYDSSDESRPNRNAETALAETERKMQLSHMTFVVSDSKKKFLTVISIQLGIFFMS